MYAGKRVMAIVLARMGSSRLPDKMLLPLGETTVVAAVMRRIQCSRLVDDFVFATSTADADDILAATAADEGLHVVRGSENDVVARMMACLETVPEMPEIVVRVCSDNALLMPSLVDAAVREIADTGVDLVSPAEFGTLPFGYSMVVMSRSCLETIDRETDAATYREHVENYCLDNPGRFRIRYQKAPADLHFPELCLTLDYPEDYKRIRLCSESVEGVAIEEQPAKLVRWVKTCRAALAVEDPAAAERVGDAIERAGGEVTTGHAVRGPQEAGDGEPRAADLLIADSPPNMADLGRFRRGGAWVERREGGGFCLQYGHAQMPEPYVVWQPDRLHYRTAADFLAGELPSVLKKLLAGFPPCWGRHAAFVPAKEKCAGGSPRLGFRDADAAAFPRTVVLVPEAHGQAVPVPAWAAAGTSETVAGELASKRPETVVIPSGEDGRWQERLAGLLEAASGAVVCETEHEPFPASLFSVVAIDGAGNIFCGSDAGSGGHLVGSIPGMTIAEAWQSAAAQQLRLDVVNGDITAGRAA